MRDSKKTIYLVVGGVLTLAGCVFLGAGVWMSQNMDYVYSHGTGDVGALPYIMAVIGIPQVLGGLFLFASSGKEERKRKRLLANGEYILAQVTDIVPDYTVRINRFPTHKVECIYTDPLSGRQQKFYSKNFTYDPRGQLTTNVLRVYVDKSRDNYKDYYVDIDSALIG